MSVTPGDMPTPGEDGRPIPPPPPPILPPDPPSVVEACAPRPQQFTCIHCGTHTAYGNWLHQSRHDAHCHHMVGVHWWCHECAPPIVHSLYRTPCIWCTGSLRTSCPPSVNGPVQVSIAASSPPPPPSATAHWHLPTAAVATAAGLAALVAAWSYRNGGGGLG